jgi:DNA invertase Pin-like site-specific DNA recombinase
MDRKDSVVLTEAVRCAIYARTASSSQPENNAAIAQQIAHCREAAHKEGWTVAEDCVRTDVGKSGITLQGRDGLHELMALSATRPRPFSYLICDSTDRLARNVSIASEVVGTLMHNGVDLHFASSGHNTADPHFRKQLAGFDLNDLTKSLVLGDKIRRGKLASRLLKRLGATAEALPAKV